MSRALLRLVLAMLLFGALEGRAVAGDDDKQHVDPMHDTAIPLTPDMIQALQDRVDTVERAKSGVDDAGRMAVPTSRSVTVSVGPGGVTNIIRTAEGFPSAVTFIDETGQPWPIDWDVNSNPAGSCDKDGSSHGAAILANGLNACVPVKGSNVLQITPLARYPRGGLIVTLKGAPKPIAFLVVAAPGRYDADMTVRVAARGPNAAATPVMQSDAPTTGAPFLTAMLDGAPPPEAVPLKIGGVSPDMLRAWRIGHTMYLRTSAQLVSPGPTEFEAEFGTSIYAIPETSVVLLSVDDRITSATLTDLGQ